MLNRAKEVFRSALIPVAERLIGRATMVRVARFLTNAVRLDVPNDMRNNGEQLVMRVICAHARQNLTVLDIGANVGDWTGGFMDVAKRAGRRDVSLHAFEPSNATYEILQRRTREMCAGSHVTVHRSGMSDEPRNATLHIVEDGAGVNSVHLGDGYAWKGAETVVLDTIDAFAKRKQFANVTFAKVDTEGHDLHVLRGARQLLSRRGIVAIQFEYNWRWIMARNYLRDVFDLAGTEYRLGKITPRGIEWYDAWHPELETFREGNYLLCVRDCVSWFPAVRWWKLDV